MDRVGNDGTEGAGTLGRRQLPRLLAQIPSKSRSLPYLRVKAMARAIWKGSISFGLVQIPVGLYTAEQRQELSLTMLDRHDLSPVGYERINRRTGEKVEWKDIVKGYAYQKGKYVVVTDEDIRRANVRATQTIDILAFVDRAEISTLFFDTPYYLGPVKQAGKAYALLRDTMRGMDKVGIAKVVIRTRQHLAAILVEDDRLVLQLLRFSHELKSPDDVELPEEAKKAGKPTSREIDMAKQLVASMAEKWDPTKYHDEYRDDLLARIKRKAKQGEIEDIDEPEEAPPKTNVIDLVNLLKQSMEKDGKGKGEKKRRSSARPHSDATHKAGAKGGSHRGRGTQRPAAHRARERKSA
jgi:DNA end-binding protein Ku